MLYYQELDKKDLIDYHLAGGDLSDWLCRTVERLKLL